MYDLKKTIIIIKHLNQYIGELMSLGFTGKIIINFHNGNISKKIKKEFIEDIKDIK